MTAVGLLLSVVISSVPQTTARLLRLSLGDYRAAAVAGYVRRLVFDFAPSGPDCAAWYEALSDALRDALSSSREKLARMGQNGRIWMQNDFAWETIGSRYIQALEWLCRGGDKPDFVYTD